MSDLKPPAGKIQPRNLPARRLVPTVTGNPVTTRIDDSVANCLPGLEFDQRNLDRRFFAGLVFNFVDRFSREKYPERVGAHLFKVHRGDPALKPADGAPPYEHELAKALRAQLSGDDGDALAQGRWYIQSIAQGGVKIELIDRAAKPSDQPAFLSGSVVWRLVRMLERDKVSLVLARRDADPPKTIELHGWRRRYMDYETGLLDEAFAPGELGQSLCSPWMHDFRDCGCNYWPSNHPDVVIPETPLGSQALPTGARADETPVDLRVDWLRADRSRAGEAQAPGTYFGIQGPQIDHFEMNRRWEELPFVLYGRESSGYFRPDDVADVKPFASPEELAAKLVQSASIEHALALEYLYARYSVKTAAELSGEPKDVVDFATFVRHELLLIAASEMRHLRWANELLWTLLKNGLIPKTDKLPALDVATEIPFKTEDGKMATRVPQVQKLSSGLLQAFVDAERPSGALDGLYSHVVATLRGTDVAYPSGMLELAEQIVADGVDHFARIAQIESLEKAYEDSAGAPRYSRNLEPAARITGKVADAQSKYFAILDNLRSGYAKGDAEDRRYIPVARDLMTELDALGDELGKEGVGIPFFSFGSAGPAAPARTSLIGRILGRTGRPGQGPERPSP